MILVAFMAFSAAMAMSRQQDNGGECLMQMCDFVCHASSMCPNPNDMVPRQMQIPPEVMAIGCEIGSFMCELCMQAGGQGQQQG